MCTFFFFFLAMQCSILGILVPQPGIKHISPALAAQSLNHWTTREVPKCKFDLSNAPMASQQLSGSSPNACNGPTMSGLVSGLVSHLRASFLSSFLNTPTSSFPWDLCIQCSFCLEHSFLYASSGQFSLLFYISAYIEPSGRPPLNACTQSSVQTNLHQVLTQLLFLRLFLFLYSMYYNLSDIFIYVCLTLPPTPCEDSS